MFSYLWPLALVAASNTLYQICAKSVPEGMDPFASLTVTYTVSAVASLLLYLLFSRGGHLLAEYGRVNWAPFVLGLVLVGLEVGFIFLYRAGWPVSAAQIVQAAVVAVVLIFVGTGLYHETLSPRKLCGIAVCLAGLAMINL